jgi:hypothetical protein
MEKTAMKNMNDSMTMDAEVMMKHKMSNRRPIVIGAAIGVVAVAWYLFRPELLFIDQKVNESFPVSATSTSESMDEMKKMEMSGKGAMMHDAKMMADEKMTSSEKMSEAEKMKKMEAAMPEMKMMETKTMEMMKQKPTTQGSFRGVAHETRGTAAIYRLADGKRILRLDDFKTSNGPDVHILLTKAADAKDDATVKREGFLDLGSLKGNVGSQNYEIPADVNLADYNSVTIWCNRFNVNFGTASLMAN